MAIYRCRHCEQEQYVPRPYRYHLGSDARCPRCGTFRLSRLKERDKIDPMRGGLYNLAERLSGGKLYHCKFCRVQFYDRRGLSAESSVVVAPAGEEPHHEDQSSQLLGQ